MHSLSPSFRAPLLFEGLLNNIGVLYSSQIYKNLTLAAHEKGKVAFLVVNGISLASL